MKRTHLLLLATVLATMACNLPKSFDELIGWSDNATIDNPVEDFVEFLGTLPDILVSLSMLIALFGVGYNMYFGEAAYKGLTTTGVILMFVSGFIPFYIPLASQLGDLALGKTTIDQVFSAFNWNFDPKILTLSTMGIAISLTVALPSLLAFYEIVMLLLLIGKTLSSIAGGNSEVVIEAVARVGGFALFLALYRLLILISAAVPSLPFANTITEPFMNTVYVIAVGGLLVLCIHGIPQAAVGTYGRYIRILQQQKIKVEVEHTHQSQSRDYVAAIEGADAIESGERRRLRRTP